jgi:preprotein translocase subunit SecY
LNPAALRQIYRSAALRKKVLTVLGLIVLVRLLAHVPVPVPDNVALAGFLRTVFNSNKLLGFADLFAGGALSTFSVIMMGLGPYINASIVMQLLTQAIPSLEALNKEGEAGRKKINQYTRLLALPLALVQSVAMLFLARSVAQQIAQTDILGHPSLFQWVLMVMTITAGSMLMMWIGEIITEKGIGNGISLLIFAGIVSQLPRTIGQFTTLASGDSAKIFELAVYAVLTLGVIIFVVLLNEGQRNIPVSYARRSRDGKIYSGVDTHLPLRVITAGVIPIIFALAFLQVPQFLSQLFSGAKTVWLANLARGAGTLFSSTGTVYAVSYFVLVVAFTYFYTSIVFQPKEIAENLQKQGGFIPGIRPGKETQGYLSRVLSRITLAGAVGLGLIAILPFIIEKFTKTRALTLGGTGLLIVVSVAIETMRQIEAQAVTTSYEEY